MLLDLTGKYADLANELDKSRATIYYLWYKNWALGQDMFRAMERAAQSLHMELRSKGISEITEAIRVAGASAKRRWRPSLTRCPSRRRN